MSNTVETVKTAIEEYQKGFACIGKAQSILSGGPSSYYFEQICGYIDVLFNKYAPFKPGDRAAIAVAPDCENGWAGHKQDLVKGAKCTVKSVDLYKGDWRMDVVLDEETYIHPYTFERTPVTTKHIFCLYEKQLVKI